MAPIPDEFANPEPELVELLTQNLDALRAAPGEDGTDGTPEAPPDSRTTPAPAVAAP